MGKVAKGVSCSVTGCDQSAVRSLSKAQLSGSDLKVSGDRRVYLCHEHYKQWKKTNKKSDDMERIRWKG
ncbi:MAG: hypothetical protein A3K61_01020 [Thaumarchaeota archaeon RBG_16_49_8]|nr:hypothetical protein [Nitrososphaerota archaeon]OHE56057.1 MAG: hypothetical protein A3K61_01020 [Thaumarchaeota archaeon RBG_16_49_8]